VKPFQQYLYSDYFFRDVERRVYAHGVTVRDVEQLDERSAQQEGCCLPVYVVYWSTVQKIKNSQ